MDCARAQAIEYSSARVSLIAHETAGSVCARGAVWIGYCKRVLRRSVLLCG